VRTFREFCERAERTSKTAGKLHCAENSRKAECGGFDFSIGVWRFQNPQWEVVMTKLFVSCALAAISFAVAPRALMAADPLCPLLDATKHGTYVVYGTGTVVGVGPAVAVGEITYDGHGNTQATFTLNVNGNVKTNTGVPGTYTINSDCTGTSLEAGAHYSFVVSPDGNTTTWMETDPGAVVSGTEVRLKPRDVEDVALAGSQ
jgi:hypothetical protein